MLKKRKNAREPSAPTKSAGGGGGGGDWDDTPAAKPQKVVSEWSDDEDKGKSSGGGGGGGGRGGGFRRGGDRDGDGDGGGFRGGRREGGGGGFRGRRHDNEDGDERRGGRGGFNRERGERGEKGEGGERRRRNDDDVNNNNEFGEEGEKKREFYIPPEPSTDVTEIFSTGITSGINFSKYDNIPVKVSGENVPKAIKNFDEAQLRAAIQTNVVKSGYKVPTPIQKVSIPVIADGRDLMACAQTGSGKTAAFLLPILSKLLDEPQEFEIGKPQAVIVSPTRELAIQIFTEARKFGYDSYLKISIVYGGTSFKHQNECITKGCHVLIATPGRLMDFVERTFITFDHTRFVVLDEADRMLDMGFSETMRKFMHHQTMCPDHQTLMFSATFPEEIQRLAGEFLNNYVFVTIGVVGGACSDVQQTIHEVNKFNKRNKLMEILREQADGTIVFVETKRGADFLASFLSETEFPTTSIHGDRLQSQREQALRDFRNGTMKVIIATSVAARGLDIKNVKHVVNFDMPNNIDDYVHRIGRTGRVGNNGRATSFFDPDQDRALASDLIKILEGSGQTVPSFLSEMGGGGGGGYSNRFGGVDVRGRGNAVSDATNAEDDQDWD
ncbi:ATP-dependent RNA helicase vasa [Drosophila gunungcola]|uniref:ATP-dependent RNA helicase vasa n=1 Tax=Drosophila gunungcola TaxID=103775 RepID=UPI0022E28E1C|nr:ATP-dependent RNA helicase vasa [Drosophila gunungcola]